MHFVDGEKTPIPCEDRRFAGGRKQFDETISVGWIGSQLLFHLEPSTSEICKRLYGELVRNDEVAD